jgi:hypothetical protein
MTLLLRVFIDVQQVVVHTDCREDIVEADLFRLLGQFRLSAPLLGLQKPCLAQVHHQTTHHAGIGHDATRDRPAGQVIIGKNLDVDQQVDRVTQFMGKFHEPPVFVSRVTFRCLCYHKGQDLRI